ncbi:hypothetical protein V1478_010866 [Vespula squamosa]|uniref:Uncharacterized protein n=1 Tax=Vespula squamosa TaxID=30214 RepID=A0ABD2AFJ7_VESSQ
MYDFVKRKIDKERKKKIKANLTFICPLRILEQKEITQYEALAIHFHPSCLMKGYWSSFPFTIK